jgi:hypothetical protein
MHRSPSQPGWENGAPSDRHSACKGQVSRCTLRQPEEGGSLEEGWGGSLHLDRGTPWDCL